MLPKLEVNHFPLAQTFSLPYLEPLKRAHASTMETMTIQNPSVETQLDALHALDIDIHFEDVRASSLLKTLPSLIPNLHAQNIITT